MKETQANKLDRFLARPLRREEMEGLVLHLANFPLPERGLDLGTEEQIQKRIEERNRLEPTNEQLDQIQAGMNGSRQSAYDEYWNRLKPELPDKLVSPVGRGWSPEDVKEQTNNLQSITKDYWPELWASADPWYVVGTLQKYLRLFWRASEDKRTADRDWYLQRTRQYCRELDMVPELQRVEEGIPRIAKHKWLLDQPPNPTAIDMALRHLQKRASKDGSRPRICETEDCNRPYFLPTASKGQTYCPECKDLQPVRNRTNKLDWYHDNKQNLSRRKKRG
jgi:hypothetical protein